MPSPGRRSVPTPLIYPLDLEGASAGRLRRDGRAHRSGTRPARRRAALRRRIPRPDAARAHRSGRVRARPARQRHRAVVAHAGLPAAAQARAGRRGGVRRSTIPRRVGQAYWGGYGVAQHGLPALVVDAACGAGQLAGARHALAARADAHFAARHGLRRTTEDALARDPGVYADACVSAAVSGRRACIAGRYGTGAARDHRFGRAAAVPDPGSAGQHSRVPEPAARRAAATPAHRAGARAADRAGRADAVPVGRPVRAGSSCTCARNRCRSPAASCCS